MEDLKNEILTQNNRHTSYVIFIVVENKFVYGVSSDFSDGRERRDIDQIDTANDLCESCTKSYEDTGDFPEECEDCDDSSFHFFRIEKDVPNLYAGFFFTGKACDEHIAMNRHHYNSTVKSYGISAYHNPELKAVMAYIVGPENEGKLK